MLGAGGEQLRIGTVHDEVVLEVETAETYAVVELTLPQAMELSGYLVEAIAELARL